MLAIRKCRHCGKEFEAIIGIDRQLYCERCRDLVSFIEDELNRQDDIAVSFHTEPPPISAALMKDVQLNLQNRSIKNIDIDSGRSFGTVSKTKPAKTDEQCKAVNTRIDVDAATLAFLDSMDIEP